MPTQSMRLDIQVPDGVQEEWRTSVTYPYYQASNLGRIRRINNQRLLSQRISEQGYPVVTLSILAKVMVRFSHILVMDAFHGPKPDDCHVQHIDSDKLNNRLENLRYVRGAISGSGTAAPNLKNAPYLPPDTRYTVYEDGVLKFTAPSLEALNAAITAALESE